MKKAEEKLTVRVTVKMDEALHAKLQRHAKKKGVTVSAYVRSLIDRKERKVSGDCYECMGKLERALEKNDFPWNIYDFIRDKYKEKENGGDV